jgi:hypothetical protein
MASNYYVSPCGDCCLPGPRGPRGFPGPPNAAPTILFARPPTGDGTSTEGDVVVPVPGWSGDFTNNARGINYITVSCSAFTPEVLGSKVFIHLYRKQTDLGVEPSEIGDPVSLYLNRQDTHMTVPTLSVVDDAASVGVSFTYYVYVSQGDRQVNIDGQDFCTMTVTPY